MPRNDIKRRQRAALETPSGHSAEAVEALTGVCNALLADIFTLYLKSKNFHWHMSGPHFRDYHLLLDEQSDQIFAVIDPLAERVRKLGGSTIRSIDQIKAERRLLDNDAAFVSAHGMLAELRDDNKQLADFMRTAHDACEDYGDIATASMLEVWTDEAERRVWFLFEAARDSSG